MVRDPDGADGIVDVDDLPDDVPERDLRAGRGLPDGLRQIAELNPLTALATATRQLFGSPTGPLPDVFTLQHPVITSLIWAGAIMAVFVPLGIRRYKRMGQ